MTNRPLRTIEHRGGIKSVVPSCTFGPLWFSLGYALDSTCDETTLQRRVHDLGCRRDVWHSSPDAATVRAGRTAEAVADRRQHAPLHRRRPDAAGIYLESRT